MARRVVEGRERGLLRVHRVRRACVHSKRERTLGPCKIRVHFRATSALLSETPSQFSIPASAEDKSPSQASGHAFASKARRGRMCSACGRIAHWCCRAVDRAVWGG